MKIKYYTQESDRSVPDTIELIAETEAEHRAIELYLEDSDIDLWWDSNREQFPVEAQS